jgi:hypothetical protein
MTVHHLVPSKFLRLFATILSTHALCYLHDLQASPQDPSLRPQRRKQASIGQITEGCMDNDNLMRIRAMMTLFGLNIAMLAKAGGVFRPMLSMA